MEEEIRGLLDNGYNLAEVEVGDFEFLEKNARYMSNYMFNNLVENIKKDGTLTSVPLCYKHDGKYKILSGNHRVKAAIEAGLTKLLVMYTEKPLSRAEQVAIALSHNSIEGKDDMVLLKDLYAELDTVDLKKYSGLNDKALWEMEQESLGSLSEFHLEYKVQTFLFLPEEVERLQDVFGKALKQVHKDKVAYVNRLKDFDRFINAQSKTSSAYDVKNTATVMMLMLDLFERHLEDLQEGWLEGEELKHQKTVPIDSVLGKDVIPAPTALLLKKAIEKMIDKGEIDKKNKSDAIKIMAERYLEGAKNGKSEHGKHMDERSES